jgi:hypothetical protein
MAIQSPTAAHDDFPIEVPHGPKTEIEDYKANYMEVLLSGPPVEKILQWFRNRGNGFLIAFELGEGKGNKAAEKEKARAEVRREIEEQSAVLKMRTDVNPLFVQYKSVLATNANTSQQEALDVARRILDVFAKYLNSAGEKVPRVLEEIIDISNKNNFHIGGDSLIYNLHFVRNREMAKDRKKDSVDISEFNDDINALSAFSYSLRFLFTEVSGDDSKVKALTSIKNQIASKALSVLSDMLNRLAPENEDARDVVLQVFKIVDNLADNGLWDAHGTIKQLHIERSLKPKEREGTRINIKDLAASLGAIEAKTR